MGVTLAIQAEYPKVEVLQALQEAILNQTALARARFERFQSECQVFERGYAMSSDEFLDRFEAGELGDAAEFFDWFAAKRGLDVWERKYRILSGVAW